MQIDGVTVFISGGGSGLGAATAQAMANRGARVGLIDFDIDAANRVAAHIGGVAAQADVSDADAVGVAVDHLVDHLGAPRVVLCCAGIAPGARMVGRDGTLSTEIFAQTIGVNLTGTFNVLAHATRAMMTLPEQDGERGVLITTASVAYEEGQMGQSAYAASKGGVAAMTLPLSRELARSAIRVVSIAPGLFNTPMMQGLPDEVSAGIIANIPHPHRLGDPAEYALLAKQIVENPYLNGTTIRLDGATRLPPR